MITKDKVFVISSNVDDSIKSASIYEDIYVFKTFSEFESYVENNPIDASMIIVNSNDLQFTNSSMDRMLTIVQSTFVCLEKFLYYLVDDESVKEKFDTLCKKNGYDKLKCVYSPTLYARDVANILTGESLTSRETVTEIRTYRIRAADYVRSQRDKEGLNFDEQYQSDEDELSGIKDEPFPDDLRIDVNDTATRYVVCGNLVRERAAWVALRAQYLAMNGKVLVIENDVDYHTLYDIFSKIDVEFEFFDIADVFKDCWNTIQQIKNSKNRFILVGAKNRIPYNYDILSSILISNLKDNVDFYIYECNIENIPYGTKVEIVTPTTVPEIFRSANTMSTVASFSDITFVGLDITSFGKVGLSEKEYHLLLQELFQENNIKSVVVSINGLLLRKEVGLGGIFMHN